MDVMKGGEIMTNRRKEALDKIMNAIPNMSEFEKGRLYGRAEAMEDDNRNIDCLMKVSEKRKERQQ